jgi:hypothetical protein
MASTRERQGSIVAFDGQPENVTTQLRLLPTSPHILILPGIQSCTQDETENSPFDIPNFIRDVHFALANRNKVAKTFLERSTTDNKRLVFMNGGTSNAQAICVRAIMRHQTDGDWLEAQNIFDHLVQGGLHGLEKQWATWKDQTCRRPESVASKSGAAQFVAQPEKSQSEDQTEDPITKAMRAADALDRETESLQQSNELDLTLTTRPRCNSLPLYGYTDSFNDAAPFFVFGAQSKGPRDRTVACTASTNMLLSPTTPRFAVTHYDDSVKELSHHDFAGTASPSCIGESYGPPTASMWSPMTFDYFTPRTATFNPRSPGNSTFGESSLIDVTSPGGLHPPPAHRRIRSLDRMFPMTPKYGDVGIDDLASTPTAVATPTPRVETFGYSSRKPGSWDVSGQSLDTSIQDVAFVKAARTVTMKPSRGTIIFDPVPKDKKRRAVQSVYVDKGTDAEIVVVPEPAFEPLFVMDEDLVVHIKDEIPDPVLDRAIQAFRDGVYPVLASCMSDSKPSGTPVEDTSSATDQGELIPEQSGVPITIASPPMDIDEYDPFAYTHPPRPVSKPTSIALQVSVERPPTPDETPTPSIAEKQDKFRDFIISSKQTAVAVQNSLRSILNTYFPPESQGYRQFQFSLLPELEALWEPIFRQAEPGSPRKDNRRVDQIIAIGSQRDVGREYSVSIMGQLENLGKKSSGLTRSGRLDFRSVLQFQRWMNRGSASNIHHRYILAAAIQTFTAQPLAHQTTNNPFNNPYILATLLIPQLETYLALHSEVRYLILEYPPEHLGTVLAMQKLVGVDLMKVAQIIDSRSTETLPFTHIRGVSIGSQAGVGSNSGATRQSKPIHSSFAAEAHLSKANFLLTASASETEIATFISTVSKILSDVSDFYIPEPKPSSKKPSPRKSKPAPLQSTFTAFPKQSIAIPSTPTTPIPGLTPRAASPALSTRAPSVSDTLRTAKSSKSRIHSHTRNKSKASRRGKQAADAASMYTFDPAEDSDYDFEEKRLMPLFLQKPKRRKGDSRKALRFLGLA